MDFVFATRQSDSEPTCEKPITYASFSAGSVARMPVHPAMPNIIVMQSRILKNRFIIDVRLSGYLYADRSSFLRCALDIESACITVKDLQSLVR